MKRTRERRRKEAQESLKDSFEKRCMPKLKCAFEKALESGSVSQSQYETLQQNVLNIVTSWIDGFLDPQVSCCERAACLRKQGKRNHAGIACFIYAARARARARAPTHVPLRALYLVSVG